MRPLATSVLGNGYSLNDFIDADQHRIRIAFELAYSACVSHLISSSSYFAVRSVCAQHGEAVRGAAPRKTVTQGCKLFFESHYLGTRTIENNRTQYAGAHIPVRAIHTRSTNSSPGIARSLDLVTGSSWCDAARSLRG